MENEEEFNLKEQLTNEYLRSGGTEQIRDVALLDDLIKYNRFEPATHTPRLIGFMNLILRTNLLPPPVTEEFMPSYKSLVQKSLFFDQVEINTEAEFDAIYEKFKASENILFRGQREASWRLYNKLQRFWIDDKLAGKGYSYGELLELLANSGKGEYEAQILALLKDNNVDVLNEVAVLGFLQHHGCPTPLMDWTYNFENALYFGMDHLSPNQGVREIDNYFSVYFIEEEHMVGMRGVMETNFDELGREHTLAAIAQIAADEVQRKEMEEHFAGRSLFDIGRVYGSGLIEYVTRARHMTGFPVMFFSDRNAESGFIFSLNNSKNIRNQQGVFVWNSSPFKPLEVVGQENYAEAFPEEDIKQYRFCECFNINKNLAPYIRARLDADGITRDFIYPTTDIDTWPVYTKCVGGE